MSLLSIILTSIGLAMDAFAVSITIGLNTKIEQKSKIAIKSGVFFGGFQGIMPVIGYLFGIKFTKYIESIDHWIAFFLLLIIGGKMIVDSIKGEEEEVDIHNDKRFILLAIATSIDALAVGISFAFLNVNIVYAASIIAIVTFILSIIAVYLGEVIGSILQKKAGIFGGVILIIIGSKILLDHLKIF